MVGVYGESEVGWTRWMKTIVGLRADQLYADVTSHTLAENSGASNAFKLSPKFSVIFGPWAKTELFINSGRGFHSNDARGTTARIDPKSGLPIDPVPGLVSSKGHEFGIKSQWIPDLQTTLAFWRLDFDSELVYVGDSGNTQPGRPSTRTGVEWSNHWTPNSRFWMDVNLAWTTPRYSDNDPAGNYIPNAVEKVANVSVALRNIGPWSGSLGVRYIGSAALIEDGSVRSEPSLTVNARVNRKISDKVDVTLDILNLTDRKNNDISYYYASRLSGEPAGGVSDVHVHPAEPRTVRLTARVRF
jgi:outer membrane receptor protein involved in Fe transport